MFKNKNKDKRSKKKPKIRHRQIYGTKKQRLLYMNIYNICPWHLELNYLGC